VGTLPEDAVALASARVDELRRSRSFPALSACLVWSDRGRWCEAQGYADLTTTRPAGLETTFAIGSVSKTLTASVALRLADDGLLDLDRDVRSYLPEFPEKAHPITARQLLSHQAGIRHYGRSWRPPLFNETLSTTEYRDVRDSLAPFSGDPLAFEPDTSFLYSTYGFTLLSAVMESAGKRPFLRLMQDELIVPLGLSRTAPDDMTRSQDRAADYLSLFGDSRVLPAPASSSSGKWAGGGFTSTPDDLVTFGRALLEGGILSSEAQAAMFTPRTLRDGQDNPQRYGLGLRRGQMTYPRGTSESVTILHHGGTSVGSQAVLLMVPDAGIVVAMTGNAYVGGSDELLRAAADIARVFMERAAHSDTRGPGVAAAPSS
jgi:CubicO group peptidase (beta-lactamase class C family)